MQRHLMVAGVLLGSTLVVPVGSVLAQATDQLERDVREEVHGDRDLRRLEVQVTGTEVTLTGDLKNFWLKSEAIRRALEVDGIETVASEIVIPPPESDEALAEDVGKAVRNYAHYTLFDYLDGRVDRGVVTLFGRVTSDRDKKGEIFERVAKINGVQDVQNEIGVLTPSRADTQLRNTIARQIFRSSHFERVANSRNPPFRVIVERSVVTLVGYVQGDIERRLLEQIAQQTQGVLQVINDLQTFQ
jgi:osmotically-inducible protein OsmY